MEEERPESQNAEQQQAVENTQTETEKKEEEKTRCTYFISIQITNKTSKKRKSHY